MGMQHSQFLRCFYALRTLLCVFLFFWMIYFYIYLMHMNDWNKMKWNLLGDVYNFQQATYLFSVFIQRESLQIKQEITLLCLFSLYRYYLLPNLKLSWAINYKSRDWGKKVESFITWSIIIKSPLNLSFTSRRPSCNICFHIFICFVCLLNNKLAKLRRCASQVESYRSTRWPTWR